MQLTCKERCLQADLLLTHPWPTGGAKLSGKAPDKKDMIKDMLGKGRKKDTKERWVSPFGR